MAAGFDALAQAGAQSGLQQNQHARQIQDEQRQNSLQIYMGTMNDPNSTPEAKDAAHQAISALYPTPAHKGTFLSDVFHVHSGQPSAQPIPVVAPPAQANPISGDTSAPSSAANDELGVPFSSGPPPSSPASPPSAAPAAATPPAQKTPIAAVQAAGAAPTPQAAMDLWKQYRGPEAIAEERAKTAAGFAQNLAETNNAARIMEAQIRAHGNVSMQKLDAAAQSLGAEDFSTATPEVKMQAMKNMASASRAPAWKSVTDGDSVYAVNSLDPTQRTLLGHKNDLTQRQEFRTMMNPDNSTYLAPVTVWTKKGSSYPLVETQDEQGAAPVSASTPQGPGGASAVPAGTATPSGTPPTASATTQSGAPVSSATPQGPGGDLAAVNASIQNGNASSKKLNKGKANTTAIPSSTVGAPIPFGGKPSELTKSDTSQYTKVAEDANGAELALASIAPLYGPGASQKPTPSSDQELVYAWVRSNVQGAGRMTQAEFQQGAKVGSFGDKVANWFSMAENGTMSPKIQQMLYSDINRGTNAKKSAAASLRSRVQQDIGGAPKSNQTPSAPPPPRPAGVPAAAVWNAQGHNGAGSWQMPK